ncbi:MAG TPA: hypothetical protein VG013_08665 [Gemmataceae bacterium]|jgi:hypothetical protein|nr:hypothetical protein [Gemmataceae bacterium]
MTSFHDLYRSHRDLSPGEDQALVAREFPEFVARSTLHWWSADAAAATVGKRLLVGVATYSEADMQLLDLVKDAVAKRKLHGLNEARAQQQMLGCGVSAPVGSAQESLRVEVFSTLDCRTHEDFDKYIPGIGKVYQTPVVGLWIHGLLREKCSGAPARILVARVCGFDLALAGQEST